MPEIGQALREARMRARIDVSEIEAQTKIRAKYLRALENEEWNLLPGPTFVKSFLRTYAHALGLDGKALVEEYRVHYERPHDGPELAQQPIATSQRRARPRQRAGAPGGARGGSGSGPSRGYAIAIAVVSLVIVLLLVGLLTGGSSKKAGTASTQTRTAARRSDGPKQAPAAGAAKPERVAVSLEATTAPVYVCLLGEGGRKLIPGLILQPNSARRTYRAKRFEVTLGNSSVKLSINGKPRVVQPSSRAIGYSITRDGRHTLAASQQPTCK